MRLWLKNLSLPRSPFTMTFRELWCELEKAGYPVYVARYGRGAKIPALQPPFATCLTSFGTVPIYRDFPEPEKEEVAITTYAFHVHTWEADRFADELVERLATGQESKAFNTLEGWDAMFKEWKHGGIRK